MNQRVIVLDKVSWDGIYLEVLQRWMKWTKYINQVSIWSKIPPFLCSPISKVPFYHMESGYTWKNYIFWWKLIYVLVVKNYKLCGHACMERCKKEKIIHITLGGGHKKCTFSFCSQFFRGQEVKWEVWRKCVICVTFLYCTFPNDP